MAELTREQRIDAAMVRLDHDGMIAAFENAYGQKWTDPEWRTEVSIWAAAWRHGRAALAARKDACPHIRGERGSHWCSLAECSPLAGSIGGGGVPLSDDQIMSAASVVWEDHDDDEDRRIEFARQIEAAHGIGALPGPDSQQPHVALPRDGGTDKLGGC